MKKLNIGIIGCGHISGNYLKNFPMFDVIRMAACADLDLERAKLQAEKFNVPTYCTVDELLQSPEIDIVVNLTVPAAHAEICLASLAAGKHVYTEKPLAVSLEDANRILQFAERKGLRVGSAPDTFMGGGLQSCRKLIEEGSIGVPVAATAFMMGAGPDRWHPDPAFYFAPGGGPMFDMGPYYLSALVQLLGPIRRVTGITSISFPERIVTSEPKRGTRITVETPTHIAGVLEFQSGAITSMITSFDIKGGTDLPRIEIYGSEGTLRVPDPNAYGGPILLRTSGSPEWREVPLTHGHTTNSRGIAVADMAQAILNGTLHRANGQLAYHVLEAMHGFHISSNEGKHYDMTSQCSKSEPLISGQP